jgi:hypothetical protein
MPAPVAVVPDHAVRRAPAHPTPLPVVTELHTRHVRPQKNLPGVQPGNNRPDSRVPSGLPRAPRTSRACRAPPVPTAHVPCLPRTSRAHRAPPRAHRAPPVLTAHLPCSPRTSRAHRAPCDSTSRISRGRSAWCEVRYVHAPCAMSAPSCPHRVVPVTHASPGDSPGHRTHPTPGSRIPATTPFHDRRRSDRRQRPTPNAVRRTPYANAQRRKPTAVHHKPHLTGADSLALPR